MIASIFLYLMPVPFAFILVSKLAMPYSKSILKCLNAISLNTSFQKVTMFVCITIGLVLSIATGIFAYSELSLNWTHVLVNAMIGFVIGLLVGGIILAVMRYSYEYIVNNETD